MNFSDMLVMKRFPLIEWRKPIMITVPNVGSGYGCRLCIAHDGIRGVDVVKLPQALDAFIEHLRTAHELKADV